MELLGFGILAVCILMALAVFEAVRSVSRKPVWAQKVRTLNEPIAHPVKAPVPVIAATAKRSAPVSREAKIPVVA